MERYIVKNNLVKVYCSVIILKCYVGFFLIGYVLILMKVILIKIFIYCWMKIFLVWFYYFCKLFEVSGFLIMIFKYLFIVIGFIFVFSDWS